MNYHLSNFVFVDVSKVQLHKKITSVLENFSNPTKGHFRGFDFYNTKFENLTFFKYMRCKISVFCGIWRFLQNVIFADLTFIHQVLPKKRRD